jgi:hypothetical protein
MGPKMLQFFQEYFGIDYPLPKQDMIALPSFHGAMENWGLITYGYRHILPNSLVCLSLITDITNREQQLLYDPDMSSDSHREIIAQVIAHEQAHQWFGNLVTMQWWNDLWLNGKIVKRLILSFTVIIQEIKKKMKNFTKSVKEPVSLLGLQCRISLLFVINKVD